MKNVLPVFLVFAMCLSLCACGHAHEFGEWTTLSEASCTEDGSKVRTCECGHEDKQTIAATGHTFDEENTVGTVSCTEGGELQQTCAVCGVTETTTVKAPGHDFAAATLFAPKTCNTCGLTEGNALSTVLAEGSEAKSDDHSFVVESIKYTNSLSDKRGNVTYRHSSDHALAIKLTFTNLATEALDRWGSDRVEDVSLEYMGKYNYEGEYWIPADDIVPLASDTLYIVYEVPESMADDDTGAIMAAFVIDGEKYSVVVQEGERNTGKEDAKANDVSGTIIKGDSVTNDATFSFEFTDLYYTDKPSYKTGNTTYTYSSSSGSYYLICKLDFTNMASETLSSWGSERITDITLKYADKYNYDGSVWIPGQDIVPLDNGYVFIVFEIAKDLETSTDSLTMTFTVDDSVFNVNCR